MTLVVERLNASLRRSAYVRTVFDRAREIDLPDWYLSAGVVAQTVWNDAFGLPAHHGIVDLDICYFSSDVDAAQEAACEQRVRQALAMSLKVDVKNQARVHLWYREKFGYEVPPALTMADAAARWPTTVSLGVRPDGAGLTVLAPFGLEDLFNLVVRPNKRQITKEIYERKVARWRPLWPKVTYVDWDDV